MTYTLKYLNLALVTKLRNGNMKTLDFQLLNAISRSHGLWMIMVLIAALFFRGLVQA